MSDIFDPNDGLQINEQDANNTTVQNDMGDGQNMNTEQPGQNQYTREYS